MSMSQIRALSCARRATLCLFALGITTSLPAAEIPRGYVCQRASQPIVIDGKLDDASWADAAWTEEFVDIEGDKKPLPRFRTRAKMLWDDQYFYFAAQLDEPHVWGTLKEHDAVIFQDNDFEIFIDPDGDNQDYGELEINALNTEWDLRLVKAYRDGGPAENQYELPGLKTAVHVDGTLNDPSDTDKGWSVEFAIPWAALKSIAHRECPPTDGDQWRVNFSRVEWLTQILDGKYVKVPKRPEDNWVWSPQGFIDMHRPEHWGFVQFTTRPPGEVAFKPDTSLPIRQRLMAVYHAQRAHKNAHKTWAETLDQLGISEPVDAKTSPVKIQLTPEGFLAVIETPKEQGKVTKWSIRQDSRLWAE
ncbi:carbohydrate-binding family 9-like protein [Singulisphaera sp. PoT]|uniref:carbohydrate-binding family 9-like protein n=1 Tax=Singulisphaera sp. PoT TaxID=3411797 RepID=UPI003BF54D78